MKLLHFSDTHLGFSEFNKIDPATGVNQREQDAYDAFTQVVEHAVNTRPDLVIHAGDLFHTPRPPNRALVHALAGFKKIVDAGIPAVVVAGNHSTPRLAASGSVFGALRLVGVKAAHECRPEVFSINGADVHCVPHMPVEEDLRDALKSVRRRPKSKLSILVTHGGIRGKGEKDSLGEFNEVVVSGGTLSRLSNLDYIALGHYHKRLKVGLNAHYSGSTERFHKKEAAYDKGFLEVDLPGPTVRFIKLDCRGMEAIEPINCRGLKPRTILPRIEAALGQVAPLDGKIVYVFLDNISPETWINLDTRSIREMAAGAFHVYLEHSSAAGPSASARTRSIGPLSDELTAFFDRSNMLARGGKRLRALADSYLREAVEEGAQ